MKELQGVYKATTPAEFYVRQFIRPRYVLTGSPASESTILTASLPGRLMEKCMAGEGLLAQMLIEKYMDHLPVHRQLERFKRIGINIAQSTANDWMQRTMEALTGLYALHRQMVLACGYLHADETPIKVLDEDKKGSTHRGYYWAYHSSEFKMILFSTRWAGAGRDRMKC